MLKISLSKKSIFVIAIMVLAVFASLFLRLGEIHNNMPKMKRMWRIETLGAILMMYASENHGSLWPSASSTNPDRNRWARDLYSWARRRGKNDVLLMLKQHFSLDELESDYELNPKLFGRKISGMSAGTCSDTILVVDKRKKDGRRFAYYLDDRVELIQ